MPAGREWSYCGTSRASAQFREQAERGGLALQSAPEAALTWVPHDTLSTQMDEYRWLWSVFDLAWQGRHPSLRADRRIWSPSNRGAGGVVYLPFDRGSLRFLRTSPLFDFPEEWTERLPGFFISELPDLFQASADLIDTLLDMAGHPPTDPKQVDHLKPPHAKTVAADDAPNKNGYVLCPNDPAAYVALNDVINEHTPKEWPLNMKQLVNILEDYKTNQVRWTRPTDKKGKPIRNRRNVHLGDWHTCCKRASHTDSEGFPIITEAQIKADKAEINRGKGGRK